MAARKPSSNEIRFAYWVLRALGGNVNNMYLLLAIVAWVRKEGGVVNRHNNPLNLRPGSDDAQWRIGTWKGAVGYFSIYKSLQDGAKATAARLKHVGAWAGYKPVISAAMRQMPNDVAKTGWTDLSGKQVFGDAAVAAWQVEQATDFLYAIALSKWSSDHYGYGKKPNQHMSLAELFNKNKIIPIWQGLLGFKVTIPADSETMLKEKPPPYPHQPRTLAHNIPTRDYIDPYGSYSWYSDRHESPPVVPSPPLSNEW